MSFLEQKHLRPVTYHKDPESDSVGSHWAPVQQQLMWMTNPMPNASNPQDIDSNVSKEQLASLGFGKNVTSTGDFVSREIGEDEVKAPPRRQPENQHLAENKENVNSTCNCIGDQQMLSGNVSSVHHAHNGMLQAIRADHMTVEQTAAWMRTLGSFNGWQEADWYAWSFQENNIWGYLLQKLTVDSLKTDLGVVKYGHRLEIMAAIKCLFPGMQLRDKVVEKMIESDHLRSPMSVTLPEAKSEGMDASPLQSYVSPQIYPKTKHDPASTKHDASQMASNPSHLTSPTTNEQEWEVLKWFSQPTGKRTSPIKEFPIIMSDRSSRARPCNPIAYIALRKVKIRSGKSIHSDHICNIRKGTVVVINQIKGRSGRVVLQLENGDFEKVGWVTLYTHDKQQLLQKHNYQKGVFPVKHRLM